METKKASRANLENKKGLFFQIGIIATLLLLLVAFNWKSNDKSEFEKQERLGPVEELPNIIQTTELTPPEPPKVDIKINTDEFEVKEDDVEIDGPEYKPEDAGNTGGPVVYVPDAPIPTKEEPEDVDDIFIVVEDEPSFPGGYGEFQKYLSENIRYPQLAKEADIQGKVFVYFIVEKNGQITNVKVLRDIGGGCGNEAKRVITQMPNWTPGMQRGKPVRVELTIPVVFTLQ